MSATGKGAGGAGHGGGNASGLERKAAAKGPKCPICGKPRDDDYRPFCSKRCADVDLGRWLKGSYAIPVRADDDEDGEDASQGRAGEADPRGGQD
jgi:endogenous inhibitor of DNA gyrase (YacG/DUF329 family)